MGVIDRGKVVSAVKPQAEQEVKFEEIFGGRGRLGGWELLI